MGLYKDVKLSTIGQVRMRTEILTVKEVPRQNASGIDGNEEVEAACMLDSSSI